MLGRVDTLLMKKTDDAGATHKTVVPVNGLPLASVDLSTILLPSYSIQSFSAGGVAADGLGAVMRSADGSGNSISNTGIGTTTRLELSLIHI